MIRIGRLLNDFELIKVDEYFKTNNNKKIATNPVQCEGRVRMNAKHFT